jgi:multisubunit Na+/H+ antiporter MnhB subunit
MVSILIQILIIAIVLGVIWWVCDYLPVPQPLNRIVKVVAMVVAIIAVVVLLARLAGVDLAGTATL